VVADWDVVTDLHDFIDDLDIALEELAAIASVDLPPAGRADGQWRSGPRRPSP
jgi:hypothetical protein